jgi:hypothetical protein
MCGNYMIRDYVGGNCLKDYIKKYKFNRELGIKIIMLFKEFKELNFTKIDIRCKDIFVEPDGRLKIIDPKKFYSKKRDFPRHLSKGFYKLGVLDDFMDCVKDNSPELYNKWKDNVYRYIKEMKED